MLNALFMNEMEYRTLEGSKAVISGYASVFNKKSQVLGGGFVEVINSGFKRYGEQNDRLECSAW